MGLNSTHSAGTGIKLLDRLDSALLQSCPRHGVPGVRILTSPQLSAIMLKLGCFPKPYGYGGANSDCASAPNSSSEYLAFMEILNGVLHGATTVLLGDYNVHVGNN